MRNTYTVPEVEIVRLETEDIMSASKTGNLFDWDLDWDMNWDNAGEGDADDPTWEGFN